MLGIWITGIVLTILFIIWHVSTHTPFERWLNIEYAVMFVLGFIPIIGLVFSLVAFITILKDR
ncbi:MAG: hypothetical protein J6X18_16970 [Bacteroidales bacterium]|nr:hypothetical protein [Bacteroidales bacterium]